MLALRPTHRRLALLGTAGLLIASLTACRPDSTASGPGASGGSATVSATPTATPAALTVTPSNKTGEVAPSAPVQVGVTDGRLETVTVVSRDSLEGTAQEKADAPPAVTGAISADGTTWKSSGSLAVDTKYVVTATAKNAAGTPTTSTTSFSTVKPKAKVTADVLPHAGWTVGVGMPVVVDFSKTVKDKQAAEAALSVQSTPAVTGAWHWISSKQVQWRPQNYWPSGTEVTVKTALDGVQVAPGIYGTSTGTTKFSIGSANIYRVDVKKHTLTATRNGKTLRVIPITTGKNGFETRNGTKVIMTRETTRRMDAATTGIDAKDPEYYDIEVKYAMRLTWSGEFLHAAPWSVGSQGHANVSHGCTGMSTANAKWLFGQSKVGDVVEYTGSTRKMEWGNGYTAWNMPYADWAA